jgi:hypothetical protein
MTGPAGTISSLITKLAALYRREPAATQTAAAVIWGGWTMIDNAVIRHTGVFSWQVAAAAIVAIYGLLVRAQVIPVTKSPVPPAPAPAPAGKP